MSDDLFLDRVKLDELRRGKPNSPEIQAPSQPAGETPAEQAPTPAEPRHRTLAAAVAAQQKGDGDGPGDGEDTGTGRSEGHGGRSQVSPKPISYGDGQAIVGTTGVMGLAGGVPEAKPEVKPQADLPVFPQPSGEEAAPAVERPPMARSLGAAAQPLQHQRSSIDDIYAAMDAPNANEPVMKPDGQKRGRRMQP